MAQELLWSSYKYTDGIVAIPSMSGYRGGAIVANQRWNWSGVEGAPSSSLIAGHSSFANDKIGLGMVLITESVNVLSNYQFSLPLAYHLDVSEKSSLSFGVSTELVYSRLDNSKVTNRETGDVLLENQSRSTLDFGFSAQFNHPSFQTGVSLQRFQSYSSGDLPANLIVFLNCFIPIKDKYDLLEPTVLVYLDNTGNWNFVGYLYYSLFDRIIVGAGYKGSGQSLLSLGYSHNNRLIFGYNYELSTATISTNLGNTHELTLRYNLNQRYYDQRKYSILSKPRSGMNAKKR